MTTEPNAAPVASPGPQPGRLLSIVIPVRNQGRTLKTLIETLRRLKGPPGWAVEIIPVYTNSRDDTLKVLQESGLPFVTCEEIGVSAARNTGAKHARGALIYFIDADACPVGDDFFVQLVTIALKLRHFGGFGGPILLQPRQSWNPVAVGDHWACWFNWSAKRPSQRSALFQPTVSLVMPKAVFEILGGFDPAVRVLEDFDLEQRMMRRGLPVYFMNSLAVTHEARDSPWRSWRHSWYWGGPFRSTYLAQNPKYGHWFPLGHRLFALNLPLIFWRRMRLVLRAAWANSKWQTCYGFLFIAATVFAWALAVICGPDQPAKTMAAPV